MLREVGTRLGDIGVLCMAHAGANRAADVLRGAGLEVVMLERYDGSEVDAVKVGTNKRAGRPVGRRGLRTSAAPRNTCHSRMLLAVRCRCMQTAAMPSITIRDVPDDVRDELAARARLSGRSLQEYLRTELARLASRPDPDVLIDKARERTKRTGSRLAAEQILAHRDHDRR